MSQPALVILPTYNERPNIVTVVRRVLEHPGLQLLIVDDNSPDGTGAIADDLARDSGGRVQVLHRTAARGLGRSYIDGIRLALERPIPLICQMDADLSHDPRHLPDLIAATAKADVAIGSRYVPGGAVVNWPRRRLLLSRFANMYVRSITQLEARDCTSGYRCWRRDALASLPLDRFVSDGYAFLVEMLFIAQRQGARIAEVPITFVERREGASKLSRGVILESAITPWRLVTSHRATRQAGPRPPR
jgi:dolichol-phosphate mannosyltransferase